MVWTKMCKKIHGYLDTVWLGLVL